MKKAIFTIASILLLAVSAQAQTNGLSLDNAVQVNFGKGVAITGKAAQSYTQTIKAKADKSINAATETTVAAQPSQTENKDIAVK